MTDEIRFQRARTFDEIAELYDRARPECPDQLVSELFALAGIEPAYADVLEIGCGTGQATLPLARRGCRVTCLEMGGNLARIAQRRLALFSRVKIINAPFEEWEPAGTFNIVLAVDSWHWPDPRLRYAKAAAALRPAGVLAFTNGRQVFPQGFDPLFSEIHACYEAIGESRLDWPPPTPEDISDEQDEIETSGCFDEVRVVRHVSVEECNADEYVELMSTASDHRLLEASKREQLFVEIRRLINERGGGRIRWHTMRILHVARRKS
jgi:SAM-dependent methyltransferase